MARDSEYNQEDRGRYKFNRNNKRMSSVYYEAYAKKKLKEENGMEIITDDKVIEYLYNNPKGEYRNHKKHFRHSMIELYRCVNNIPKDKAINFDDLPEIPIEDAYIRAYVVAVLSENSSKKESFMNKIKYGNAKDITFLDKIKFTESVINEISLIDNDEIKDIFINFLKIRIFDDISEVIDSKIFFDKYLELCENITFDDYCNNNFETQIYMMIDNYTVKNELQIQKIESLKEKISSYNYDEYYQKGKKSILANKFRGMIIDILNENQELSDLCKYITDEVQRTLSELYLYKYGNNILVPMSFVDKKFVDDCYFGLTVNNDTAFGFGINDKYNILEILKKGIVETINEWKKFVKEEFKEIF